MEGSPLSRQETFGRSATCTCSLTNVEAADSLAAYLSAATFMPPLSGIAREWNSDDHPPAPRLDDVES